VSKIDIFVYKIAGAKAQRCKVITVDGSPPRRGLGWVN
jgi:hypothetical protein